MCTTEAPRNIDVIADAAKVKYLDQLIPAGIFIDYQSCRLDIKLEDVSEKRGKAKVLSFCLTKVSLCSRTTFIFIICHRDDEGVLVLGAESFNSAGSVSTDATLSCSFLCLLSASFLKTVSSVIVVGKNRLDPKLDAGSKIKWVMVVRLTERFPANTYVDHKPLDRGSCYEEERQSSVHPESSPQRH